MKFKSFFYTVGGKLLLFGVTALLLLSTLASAVGIVFSCAAGAYTDTHEKFRREFLMYNVMSECYRVARSLSKSETGAFLEEIADPEIDFAVFDVSGKLVAANSDAVSEADSWEYALKLWALTEGADRDENGEYTEIVGYSLVDIYDMKVYDSPVSISYEDGIPDNVDRYVMYCSVDRSDPQSRGLVIMSAVADFIYSARFGFIGGVAAGLILTVICFAALMCVSARNKNGEICAGVFNKVPFDIIFAVTVLLTASGIALGVELANWGLTDADSFMISALGVTGIAVAAVNLLLGLSMSIAARLKQKNLLKNTIIWYILRLIWRFVKAVFHAIGCIPHVWKTAICFAAVCILEYIMYCAMMWDAEAYTVAVIIEKLFISIPVLYVAFCLRRLQKAGEALAKGEAGYSVNTKGMFSDFRRHGEALNSIGEGIRIAVEEQTKSERMKTELITNVSHDIKTPLTSIINYADIICREECENEKICEYSQVLLRQSERLKRLIDDLVEASKAATGNLEVVPDYCDAGVFISQAAGEYEEKLNSSGLTLVCRMPQEPVTVMADSRRMLRVFDNLLNNICKYSQSGTRVYLSLEKKDDTAVICFKNTSRDALNIEPDELMERFVRGDSSRNTEGSGLGLSIAKSLVELQGGKMELLIDGDLFKVILKFPAVTKSTKNA